MKEINLDNKDAHNDVHNIISLTNAIRNSAEAIERHQEAVMYSSQAIVKLCANLVRAYDSLLRDRMKKPGDK